MSDRKRRTCYFATMPKSAKKSFMELFPGTEAVIVNLQDGFSRKGKVQKECADAVGLKYHSSIVRMMAGSTPVPIHYVVTWARWLDAPPGWPMLSWDVAERMFARRQGRDK